MNKKYDEDTIRKIRMDCSCVKRINKSLSKTWCYCTLGYAKRLFEYIFNEEIEVELLSSIKMGDEKCQIKIIKTTK